MADHLITTIFDDGKYVGWPTVGRNPKTGRIFVVFSGKRLKHVCPFGQVVMIISDDDGRTWSDEKILANGPLDDRDAGICITSNGTVLVNWFTSIAFAKWTSPDSGTPLFPEESAALTDDLIGDELGQWMVRSFDDGETFEPCKIPTCVNSPHGPCELNDGTLFYIGKLNDDREARINTVKGGPHRAGIGIARSVDDGGSWQVTAETLPLADGQKSTDYCEYHAIQLNSGRIITQFRNHSYAPITTWQMESDDLGTTWTTPREICVGMPSHLLQLQDGKVLMSYSHREDPMSNLARTSDDDGQTWTRPFVFGPVRPPRDMGYPSTIQLPNQELLSVWYAQTDWVKAVIRMARWTPQNELSDEQ